MEVGKVTSKDAGCGVGRDSAESWVERNRADPVSCMHVSEEVDEPGARSWRWRGSPHSFVAEDARGSHAFTVFSIHPVSDDSMSRIFACSSIHPHHTTSFSEEKDQASLRDRSRARARGRRQEQDVQMPLRMRGRDRLGVRGDAGVVRRDLPERPPFFGRGWTTGHVPNLLRDKIGGHPRRVTSDSSSFRSRRTVCEWGLGRETAEPRCRSVRGFVDPGSKPDGFRVKTSDEPGTVPDHVSRLPDPRDRVRPCGWIRSPIHWRTKALSNRVYVPSEKEGRFG